MKEDLVTCAFSTYNCFETLESAIYSAINQTYKNIEILVVDDNSIDNTKELIRKLAKQSKVPFRIIYNNKNIGIGAVRNILIENSKGIFIAFFDDDDFSYSDRIRLQYSVVSQTLKIRVYVEYRFSYGKLTKTGGIITQKMTTMSHHLTQTSNIGEQIQLTTKGISGFKHFGFKIIS